MELKLSAQIREDNEKLSADFMPAVLYGKGIDNQNLKLKRNDFNKLFNLAGESNLINLDYGTGPVKVLIKDFQRDILKDFLTHVDFYQVNMKEKINTEIPLHFIGESKAVKELGGMLMKEIDAIEVECYPNDLVDHFDVDISVLKTFEDFIRVSDVNIPENMVLAQDGENIVVAAKPPRVEEVEVPVETEEAPKEETEKEEGEKKE